MGHFRTEDEKGSLPIGVGKGNVVNQRFSPLNIQGKH